MRRIKSFVPVATLKTVYKGLVLPYFENFSPLWANCGKLLKDKLQRFKSRATRVLKGATYDIRSAGLIDSLSWQTLDDRRRCAKSILMYTIIYSIYALSDLGNPSNLIGSLSRTMTLYSPR